MRKKSVTRKQLAERRFQFRVDFRVPANGFAPFDVTHQWCRKRLARDEWDQHGYLVRGQGVAHPYDVVRFYFLRESDARAFNAKWGGKLLA